MRGRILSFVSLDSIRGCSRRIPSRRIRCTDHAYGVQITQIAFGIVCLVGGLLALVMTPGFRAFSGQRAAHRRSRHTDEPAGIPSVESRSFSRPTPGQTEDGDS
jgi:hypothetical protein